ncbi:MAG: archease [Candidatus Cloacimonadaceae bacterium]
MKSRIYKVLNDSTEDLKVSYFGCNYIDIFYNGLEGFRRLIYKKNPNRPEPQKPDYPIIHQTFEVTGKNYEEIFTEWMRQLLAFTQSGHYLPLWIDTIKLDGNSLKIQISFRMAMKRDKVNIPIKSVAYEQAKLDKIKSGYQITVTYTV